MTFARLVAVLAIALTAAVGATAASATTTASCQAQLTQLRVDTVAAEGSFTNVRDFQSALLKLDSAAEKLGEGKNADAVNKLRDFQSLLVALSTAPKQKVDPATTESLVAEAGGVIACIEAIDAA